MPFLSTNISPSSEEFRANSQWMSSLVKTLQQNLEKAKVGGGTEAIKKHKARGKLTARERIQNLIDPGTPFLEFSSLAAFDLYEGAAPAAGIITGIGMISRQECIIVSNDATVKGGTYFPLTVKKHLRAQEVALENGLPCILPC